MPEAPPHWTTVVYCMLPHPDEPRILMQRGDDRAGWSLPVIEVQQHLWMQDIGPLMPQIEAVVQRRTTMLYAPYYAVQREPEHRVEVVYALENLSGDAHLEAHGAWIAQTELSNLPLVVEAHRAILASYFAELNGGEVSTLRPVWSREGWFAEAETWTIDQLEQHGYHLTGPVELVRNWGISCVLRVSTDHGIVYFKVASSGPLFGHEPMLMRALHNSHPDLIPAPLAIDVELRWMLLPDLGSSLRDRTEVTLFEDTLRALATLQLAYVERSDALFTFGCLDRRLARLATQIDPLLADDALLEALSAEELAMLRSLAPRLIAMCTELAERPVPQTLVHGDLNLGNIAYNGQSLRLFDWTDGAVSHPFFDLVTVLEGLESVLSDESSVSHLRDVYLSMWSQFGTHDELHNIWKLAEPLGALQQAVSYQHIAYSLEGTSKQELGFGVMYWLRFMLKALKTTPTTGSA